MVLREAQLAHLCGKGVQRGGAKRCAMGKHCQLLSALQSEEGGLRHRLAAGGCTGGGDRDKERGF